jgi:carbon-monoxide dehydrogenase small subunit
VLLEGEPVRSCLTLAHNCQDRQIVTIEGASAILDRLRDAFIRAGAVQCGFCTPGMILSASALLAGNPNPGVEEIRDALSGNLCRCTGFRKIVDAVLLASESAAP